MQASARVPPTGSRMPLLCRSACRTALLLSSACLGSLWALAIDSQANACPQERDQAVQKRAYKLLATVCEQRPGYLRAHLQVSSIIWPVCTACLLLCMLSAQQRHHCSLFCDTDTFLCLRPHQAAQAMEPAPTCIPCMLLRACQARASPEPSAYSTGAAGRAAGRAASCSARSQAPQAALPALRHRPPPVPRRPSHRHPRLRQFCSAGAAVPLVWRDTLICEACRQLRMSTPTGPCNQPKPVLFGPDLWLTRPPQIQAYAPGSSLYLYLPWPQHAWQIALDPCTAAYDRHSI